MPKQARSADESAGRRFKRRKRKRLRGKRGAVSERRGRDKSVEGKERQKRDRTERPGDRKFGRSRKRKPARRKLRRKGSEQRRVDQKDTRRERPGTGLPRDKQDFGRGREERGGGDIQAQIEEIKRRRAEFSSQRPEQVAERRGMAPDRLREFQAGGRFQQPGGPAPDPQGQPTNLDQVNAYDAPPEYGAQPQPAPAPPVIGPDGRVGAQPQPAPAPAPAPGMDPTQNAADPGFTPLDQPGPTAPPGIATDAYGKPVGVAPGQQGPLAPGGEPAPGYQGPRPGDPPQVPGGDIREQGYLWSGRQPQVNPRAAGMDRFARPPQPITQPGGPPEQPRY